VVTVEDGRAVKLRGNPDHPYSQGELCPKVNRFLDRVYAPDRLLHPLVRVGAKGEGRFEQVTWDAATSLIAERLHRVRDEHGGEAILPWWDAGTQGRAGHRERPNEARDTIAPGDGLDIQTDPGVVSRDS
jgi:anaerobic selenocysteine-containing dehydrogenase